MEIPKKRSLFWITMTDDFISIGKLKREQLLESWQEWITDAKIWKSFTTLTYRDFRYRDMALKDWGYLLRALNRDVFGRGYTKICKHSYFSYVLGIEEQTREVIHFHFIADQPLNFQIIHDYWNFLSGWAWTDQIKCRADAVRYVCKYVMKGGDVKPYFAKKVYEPKIYPYYWFS